MSRLEAEQISEFRERFYSFYDGLLRSVNVLFRSASRKAEAQVTVSVRDSQNKINDSWVNVSFIITDVTEFTLHESSKESYQVLSNGLYIKHFGDIFWLEFGHCIDEPADVDEIRRSKFYIAGKAIEWEVTSYQSVTHKTSSCDGRR